MRFGPGTCSGHDQGKELPAVLALGPEVRLEGKDLASGSELSHADKAGVGERYGQVTILCGKSGEGVTFDSYGEIYGKKVRVE